VIGITDLLRQGRIVRAQLAQGETNNFTTGGRQVEPADTVAVGIGSVPLAHALDGVVHPNGIERLYGLLMRAAGVEPARRGVPAVVQDCVVEIQ
jgi:hypothetical protein